MPDHFATLSQPRRPWLDREMLKETFLGLSAKTHPDRFHDATQDEKDAAHQRHAELNEAYRCLADPRERLKHLIELETGRRPAEVQAVPGGMLELFMEITPCLRQADSLVAQKDGNQSPLLRACLLEKSQSTIDQLQDLRQRLEHDRSELEAELKSQFDEAESSRVQNWVRLEEIFRRLSYLKRWLAQIHESILQLSP